MSNGTWVWPGPDPNRNVVDLDKVESYDDLRRQLTHEGWIGILEAWRRCGAGENAYIGIEAHPVMPDGILMACGNLRWIGVAGMPRDVVLVLGSSRHPTAMRERVETAQRWARRRVIVVEPVPWWEATGRGRPA